MEDRHGEGGRTDGRIHTVLFERSQIKNEFVCALAVLSLE